MAPFLIYLRNMRGWCCTDRYGWMCAARDSHEISLSPWLFYFFFGTQGFTAYQTAIYFPLYCS